MIPKSNLYKVKAEELAKILQKKGLFSKPLKRKKGRIYDTIKDSLFYDENPTRNSTNSSKLNEQHVNSHKKDNSILRIMKQRMQTKNIYNDLNPLNFASGTFTITITTIASFTTIKSDITMQ